MKRFVIAITGGTVVLLGITMIALPGPAVVVIPAGLAILATEFLWARRALQVFKGMTARARASIRCSAAEGADGAGVTDWVSRRQCYRPRERAMVKERQS
jgi:hypothetical protein